MIVYWTMFILPTLAALFGLGRKGEESQRELPLIIALFLFFVFVMGFRYEVGGDWDNYVLIVRNISLERLSTALSYGDPGFTLIAWLSNQLGLGVYGANLGCALFLLYGLFRLARTLPDPWLAIATAVPYMLIVIGMGYVRQGAAIGFIMLAMRDLERRQMAWGVLHLALAIVCHIAAICILPLIAIGIAGKRPFYLVPIFIVGLCCYAFILSDRTDHFYSAYVEQDYESSGAVVRLAMNVLPAGVYLRFRDRFPIAEPVQTVWRLFAIISLALPVFLLVLPSTALDRIGLFFSPIQVIVFGYATTIFSNNRREQRFATFAAAGYYGVVQFVWLNFATFSAYWLPYRSVLFQS